ncbi:MAG: hypothetical protein JRH15_02830 [Deltaproteobacteria bacterium]|nr:hypothetical protein [Deltaproteobacteria bacterium]
MRDDIPEKYKANVVMDLPKIVEVPGHHKRAPFWIAPGMFPGVNIRVAGIDVSKIVGAPHAGPHVHDTPEIYFAPSEEKGVALVEIQMDEEVFTVESPFALFIPPGVKHCFKVLKCDAPHFIYGLLITDQAG